MPHSSTIVLLSTRSQDSEVDNVPPDSCFLATSRTKPFGRQVVLLRVTVAIGVNPVNQFR